MLYCKENEDDIFHIHIPRTGGRFIRELFAFNSYKFYHYNYSTLVEGVECPHLHYPLYNLLEDVEECKKFVIVRNPFERFKSSIKLIIKGREYDDEIYTLMKNKNWLFDFLDYERSTGTSYLGNVFRPQNEYLNNNALIYKFENGINENFTKWIKEFANVNLKYVKVFYDKGPIELRNDPIAFTKIDELINSDVEKIIKEYYRKDYEIFNYE